MIPLHDDNPTELRPILTVSIIVACTLIFLWQVSLGEVAGTRIVYSLGMIPAVVLGDSALVEDLALVPPSLSVVTSMFLHGGWMHLIGNMLFLWVFGNNVEDALGHIKFFLFYFVCGIAAALTQAFQDPSSTVPMIGASGAIGGVLGAYIMMYPRAKILVLLPIGFIFLTPRIPALVVLGIWFLLQFLQGAMAGGGAEGGVAHWAHIGGFVAGLLLVIPLRRPGHPLFGSGQMTLAPRRYQRSRSPWDPDAWGSRPTPRKPASGNPFNPRPQSGRKRPDSRRNPWREP